MSVVINGDTGISGVNGHSGAPALTGSDADTGVHFGTNTASISTGGTNRLHVDSGGNIGLGTDSPSSYSYTDLVLAGSTGGMSIVTATNATGRMVFADGIAGVGAYRGAVQYDHSNDRLEFAAEGSVKAYLTSTGLGIGLSGPARAVSINSDADENGIHIRSTTNKYPAASTGHSDILFTFTDYLDPGTDNGGSAVIRGQSTNAYAPERSAELRFLTSTSDGTATPRLRQLISPGGTYFYTPDGATNTHILSNTGVFYGVGNGHYFMSKPQYTQSFSPGSTITAGTTFEIVPQATLANGNTYLITVYVVVAGPPYHHGATATFSALSSNTSGSQSNFSTGGIQSTHVSGSYLMEFRMGPGFTHVQPSIQIKLNYQVGTGHTFTVKAYRVGH